MASASPYSDSARHTHQRVPAQPVQRVLQPAAQFLGFWAAIVLPVVLLALVASGLATQHPELAAGLVVGNLAGLRLGRGYKR